MCVLPGHAQPTQESIPPAAVWNGEPSSVSGQPRGSETGHPGPNYWQNHVEYAIEARLDTSEQRIQGSVEITYTNNSPTPLPSVWFLLKPNPTRSSINSPPIRTSDITIQREEKESYEPSTLSVNDRLQVRLKEPIEAGGNTRRIRLKYEVPISEDALPNRTYMRDGPIYSIGNWFPHVAAYTAMHGWATLPSPTFPAYGSIDYSITLPSSFIIAGSGTLLNPGDVLTDAQRRRLNRARDSRDKVSIITPDKAGTPDTRPPSPGLLTWKFGMNGVRTAAWVASPAFVWNAARIERTGRRDGLAMSYYPRSSVSGQGWNRSTYHAQKATNFYTNRLHKYPWTNTINVATPVGQRAFPGLSMCPHDAVGYSLFSCSVQNQSHNWFPTIVGTNSDRYPWMNDGLATLLSVFAHRNLYEGEFAPKDDEEYAPGPDSIPARSMAAHLKKTDTAPISTPPQPGAVASSRVRDSFKPAFGLQLLRDYVLTPDQFDHALRQYAQRWTYKTATPADFFNTIEDASGTDLSWFWKSWFDTTWQVDLAVREVTYENGTPGQGARITFGLNDKMPMPVRATVIDANDTEHKIHLPVHVWRDGPTQTVALETEKRLKRVRIDPDGTLPDATPANNTWTADAP